MQKYSSLLSDINPLPHEIISSRRIVMKFLPQVEDQIQDDLPLVVFSIYPAKNRLAAATI